ncbi:cyclase family protein [Halobacillus litoralis]|uniref:cyclase family protein n=1 Tax=Halobacillus litoralis TaxID=45668 RepID=UPI001CFD5798|nr:cyclase family protein [Halobacillus litoralis]
MQIKKIVDLSIPVTNETPVYPGDPKPHLCSAANIEEHGYNVSELNIGSHTGTHVDAPYHIVKDGKKIDEVSLDHFAGEGVVLDVTDKNPGAGITIDDIRDGLDKLQPGKIVLFHTGWDAHVGTDLYFEHPYLTIELVHELLERGVRTFFIDALNIDPPDGSSFQAHEAITGVNGIIGENFTNFDQIDFDAPFITAFPLKLSGIDGSPVRAVAMEL